MTKRNKQSTLQIHPFCNNSNIYKCYREGEKAGRRGTSHYVDPYSSITDSNRSHWWFRGWREGRKFFDERIRIMREEGKDV